MQLHADRLLPRDGSLRSYVKASSKSSAGPRVASRAPCLHAKHPARVSESVRSAGGHRRNRGEMGQTQGRGNVPKDARSSRDALTHWGSAYSTRGQRVNGAGRNGRAFGALAATSTRRALSASPYRVSTKLPAPLSRRRIKCSLEVIAVSELLWNVLLCDERRASRS